MEKTPQAMGGIAPTISIKIIAPFRWWKTFGINSAIGALFAFPLALNSLNSYNVAKGVHDYGLAYAVGAFLGYLVFASVLIGAFLALMLCTAQMWALIAYYRCGGHTNVYYSRLYAVSAVLLVTAPFGIPIISLPWALIYYFSRRQLVLKKIRELGGTPIPLRPAGKADYRWPLVVLAAAILIAALIIYAALQHQRPALTTLASAVSASPTPLPPQAHRGDFDPSSAIPAEDAHKLQELGGSTFFESKEYSFSVYLPETPAAKQRLDSKSGISVTDFTCLGRDITKGYLFSITTTYDTSGGSTEAFFNGISHPKRNGIAGAPLNYLGEARDLNGHKGREYTFNTVAGGVEMVGKYRAFLENGKAYGVGVTAPKDLWNEQTANAYLNTFRIHTQ